MKATALVCDENREFTLEPVSLPGPAPDQVAIRTHYTGVSIGTEFGYIQGKTPVPYPLTTGYQGTGVIEAVGAEVTGFEVGDEVYFRRNDSIALEDGTAVTCRSGAHASHAVTQAATTHGVEKLPPGAPMDVASMFVMPAVGLYGVDMANPRMGEVVVVYGVGLIGLGVVAACVHRGCVVVAVDLDETRLDVARKMGADHVVNGSSQDVEAEVRRIAPEGADVVFEATGIPSERRSGHLAVPALRQLRVAGELRERADVAALHPAAPPAAEDVLPVRRRLAAVPARGDQEHGHGGAEMGALRQPPHRLQGGAGGCSRAWTGARRDGIVGVVIDWTGSG